MYKYAELLERLNRIDEWFDKLGIPPKNDRVHFAIEVLREAEGGFRKMRETGQPTKVGRIEDFLFGIVEALEIHDIYAAFEHDPPALVAPSMERALSGPSRPIEENQRNADGRNIGFELALAAEWRERGARVDLAEPDLRLTVDHECYLVACKRPLRQDSIRGCIRGAASQLNEHLSTAGENTHGVIAISLSRILNPGDKFFAGELERLGDILERHIRQNEHHWKKAELHDKICAVLFHAATPAEHADKGGLLRMTFSVGIPAGDETPVFKTLAEHLKGMYE